jgi:hypothetical protein
VESLEELPAEAVAVESLEEFPAAAVAVESLEEFPAAAVAVESLEELPAAPVATSAASRSRRICCKSVTLSIEVRLRSLAHRLFATLS